MHLAKAGGAFLWHVRLPIPHDYYRGRVTRCAVRDSAVYVLVQMDTDSHQSTSPPRLREVELDRSRGAILATKDIAVPGAPSAYTAWVNEGDRHFGFTGAKLVISGAYDLRSEKDSPTGRMQTSFTVALTADFRP